MRIRLQSEVRNLLGAAGLLVGLLSGCSQNTSGHWFEKPKTSHEWLDLALEATSADERRRGVVGLSRSADGSSDWALKVYDAIARTDKDAMVRCAAVKAMGRSARPEHVPTLLTILNSPSGTVIRPATGPLRWEAAQTLLAMVQDHRYDNSQRPEIVRTLLDRLAKDPDRNVRLTVIETLAYFAEPSVPSALIEAIREDDYAIQHASEEALIALTGVTHLHDPKAWRAWLDSTKDPFERAGQTPEGLSPRRTKTPWGWGR